MKTQQPKTRGAAPIPFTSGRSVMVTVACLVVLLPIARAPAQTNLPKGWKIAVQPTGISGTGYRRARVTVTRMGTVPLKDDVKFLAVVTSNSFVGSDHVTSTPIVVPAGVRSQQVDVYFPNVGNAYYGADVLHIEQDGNLRFDPNRDLWYTVLGAPSSQFSWQGWLPSILIVNPTVVPQERTVRLHPQQRPISNETTLSLDEDRFPSIGTIAAWYEQVNDQGVSNKKNPTAYDALENTSLHAIPPKDLPQNWIGLLSADILLIPQSDLLSLPRNGPQLEALRQWTAAGGTLVVSDCGAAFADAATILQALVGTQLRASVLQGRDAWRVPGKKLQELKARSTDGNFADTEEIFDPSLPGLFNMDSEELETQELWNQVPSSQTLQEATKKADCPLAARDFLAGQLWVIRDDTFDWKLADWQLLIYAHASQGRSLNNRLADGDLNRPIDGFAIADVGRPPIREFEFLIGLFLVVIGPVSYGILRSQRRLYLLFVTVPVLSFFACTTLLTYAFLSDGIQNRGRMRSYTTMDQSTGRAVSFIRHSHYCGVQPPPYNFAPQTAVVNGRAPNSSTAFYDREPQRTRVTGGEIRPRMPHQLVSLTSYTTNRGLVFKPSTDDQPPSVRNELGGTVRMVLFRTPHDYYQVENLGVGETVEAVPLNMSGKKPLNPQWNTQVRLLIDELSPKVDDPFLSLGRYDMYGNGRSSSDGPSEFECDYQFDRLRRDALSFLPEPGYYIALLQAFPEIPDPQANVDYKNKLHVIHGRW